MHKLYKVCLLVLLLALAIYTVHYWVTKSAYSVEDFRIDQFDYADCYKRPYSKGSYMIVLSSDTKEYFFRPVSALLPDGYTMEYVYDQLLRSNYATVWYDETGDKKYIMGVRTEYLSIPPSYGLEFHKSERKALLWGNLFAIALVVLNFWAFRDKT